MSILDKLRERATGILGDAGSSWVKLMDVNYDPNQTFVSIFW